MNSIHADPGKEIRVMYETDLKDKFLQLPHIASAFDIGNGGNSGRNEIK